MAIAKRIKRRVKWWLVITYLYFKTYKLEDTIIICSEARGGSTWLMELLRNVPGTLVNWEPLHVTRGVVPPSYNLGWRPMIPIDEKTSQYTSLFRKMLTLKIHNPWTLRFVDVVDLRPSVYILTKFVRANNCLPWLVTAFPQMKNPPIFLLRHPITTCISRLKTFESKEDVAHLKSSKNFVVPECIHNERFLGQAAYINSLETALEFEIAIWCVNNAAIVTHELRKQWYTLYYEALVKNPIQVLSQLCKALKLPVSEEKIRTINYRKPSVADYNDTLQKDVTLQLESFLTLLTDAQLQKIQAIFDHYNFKAYTAYSAYPIKTF